MNDREMLELAAKAAGIAVHWNPSLGMMFNDRLPKQNNDIEWNPLTHDGDALRLAVSLRISVDFYDRKQKTACACAAWVSWVSGANSGAEYEELLADPYKATRRAIVRAAAEIGKSL